jgi:hypothetical protein
MPNQLWSQDNFTKGELSPYMYGRAQVEQYNNGLKQALNVLNYPTGAAGKRFGTLYQATISGATAPNQIFFQTFQYLDQCIYQLVFTPMNIAIYLEGILIANVSNGLDAQAIPNLNYTVIGAAFRVAVAGFAPIDLTRIASTPIVIFGNTSNYFTSASPVTTAGFVLPIVFTTSSSLPVTSPQVKIGVTYFAYALTSNSFQIYSTAREAKFNINAYVITNIGSGSNIVPQNTWTFAFSVFRNLPVYDFNGNYDSITFTPGAVIGITTLTASSPIFTPGFAGGAFFGAGGSARLVTYTSSTVFQIVVQTPFDGTGAIQGSLSLLAEPAWSDARGWPQKCSSYQNRALFANTDSLPNGFWTSVTNDYTNFGDLTNDDDDAISWFPTSNDVNVIRFIVPFRSITVHTNSGIYSSPLSEIAAITPSTFTLQLQDSTPADVLQPQAIDNQIIVLSGNDVHTMLWDGINNAYTSNIVSIVNEQTIREPVDETTFADLRRAGSRYVFIINGNGSMAVYQTLQAEQVSGITPQIMEQSYGSAQFRQAASSFSGRCWFLVQRQQATAGSPIAITGNTTTTLTATASSFSTTVPTAITFTTSGTLPTRVPAVPALAILTNYWALGVDANTFSVYVSQSDALAKVNAFVFSDFGMSASVTGWPLSTIFTLEELTQDVRLDCAVQYPARFGGGTPTDTITTGALFNAQAVKMVGNGFGFDAIGVNNQVTFEAHNATVNVTEAFIGFPIRTLMEPMPLTPPKGDQNTLTKPKHIRSVRFMFNNTIGGRINGVPIALDPFNMANIGEPPFPARGIFEMSIMKGWDDFTNPTFTIEHDEPFNIELIGVFYTVDTY